MSGFFKTHTKEIMWAGRTLTLETGRIARQSDAAVVARYGDTTVLATVCSAKKVDPSINFFPLTVHYLEKHFAVGRIPGGFTRREGKPSDHETLTARLIDRPIRPLFPENFFKEVQVICTVLSYDQENDAEIVALIAASAALSLSGLPFQGPIAAARVGYNGESYVLNPKTTEITQLDLVVAGTKDGVLMVESEAHELSEDVMLGAVVFGHEEMQPILKMINDLQKVAGKEIEKVEENPSYAALLKKVKTLAEKDIKKAYTLSLKQDRYAALDEVYEKVVEKLGEDADQLLVNRAFESLKSDVVRTQVIKDGVRLDGRDLKTVRPIQCDVNVLPRVHGSALFTRGETQALVVATLGTAQDEQIIDGIDGEYKERFLLHYNFNPYSVGETGRMGSPGRREIGHGRLALRAVRPLLPSKDKFSYSIRMVSEITESNGSSSMATVCGTSLAMMDAGIPLTRPIAGIAMGLIKEGKKYAVLTDILGDEDHLGDMDFKVAGTEKGVTALQMDLKITSITPEIMDIALKQAKDGRMHILGKMEEAISASRNDISDNAPKMATLKINKDKIRDLIGPGGKVIRELCERFQAKIEIEETGIVSVAAASQEKLKGVIAAIEGIAKDPEVGEIYDAVVVKLMDFGAFVRFMGEREGLVHISEVTGERIERVSDYLKVGDKVSVKFLGTDDRGKSKLSMKGLNTLHKKEHH